jgi:hypothetical protein
MYQSRVWKTTFYESELTAIEEKPFRTWMSALCQYFPLHCLGVLIRNSIRNRWLCDFSHRILSSIALHLIIKYRHLKCTMKIAPNSSEKDVMNSNCWHFDIYALTSLWKPENKKIIAYVTV